MAYHTLPSDKEPIGLLNLICQSVLIERHLDLMCWLQGELQNHLPHDILLTSWGDFEQGFVQHDILSELPGARSYSISTDTLPLLMKKLHGRWTLVNRKPFKVNFREFAYLLGSNNLSGSFTEAMRTMQYALIHGIRDARTRQDCIYVLLSSEDHTQVSTETNLDILLPCIDAAFRKIPNSPQQCLPSASLSKTKREDTFGLSEREIQILDWVGMGKTNSEIGMILTISAFTVKNHMQRIFQKLNVFNRAQAVSKVIRITLNA